MGDEENTNVDLIVSKLGRRESENFCVDKSGGCCGDTFYHWGALAGYMAIVEAGK